MIYAITNTVSGKRYVGLTTMTLARRWWHHVHAAKRGVKTALYDAMRKHGVDVFRIEAMVSPLAGTTRDQLGQLERDIIRQEGTMVPAGYNLTAGGDGVRAGFKHKAPSKLIGRQLSAETRAKMSASRMGKPSTITDVSRAKISATLKSRGLSPNDAQRAALARGAEASRSPEAIAARRAYWTPERRAAYAALTAARIAATRQQRAA